MGNGGPFREYFRLVNICIHIAKSISGIFATFYAVRDARHCQLYFHRAIFRLVRLGLYAPSVTMQLFSSSQSFINERRFPAPTDGVPGHGMVCLLHR